MATKEIRLNYVSVERFLSDYVQLCKGRIFLPAKAPLPENTSVTLQIFIPVVEQKVAVEGAVIKAIDAQTAGPLPKSSGMLVGLGADPADALNDLNYALSTNVDYRDLLDLAPPDAYARNRSDAGREKPAGELELPEIPSPDAVASLPDPAQPADDTAPSSAIRTPADRQLQERQADGPAPADSAPDISPASGAAKRRALSMKWIRGAIAQEEATREKEAAAQVAAKNRLTEDESSRVKPSAEFLMDSEELPADVQYFVNTDKMAKDVQIHIQGYVNRFLHISSREDAAIMLKLFRRVLPALIETASWRNVFYLTRAMHKIIESTDLFTPASGRPANPLIFVFKGCSDAIAAAYDKVDASQRKLMNDICSRLGIMGVEILSRALSDSQDRFARKAAMEALMKKGGLARDWIFRVLDSPEQKWYLTRNALMLLGYVGEAEQDIARAHAFLSHKDPRVRYEALNTLIRKKAADTEKQIIAALDDVDDKVRWRAMNGLGELAPISEESIRKLLAQITAESPHNKDEADKHNRNIAQLIRALGAIPHIPNHAEAEDSILDLARGISIQKKGLLQRFKKAGVPDRSMVLSSAVNTLGNIGSAKSESFLEELAAGKSPLAESAQKAANHIKLRLIEQLSNTPADNPTPAGV